MVSDDATCTHPYSAVFEGSYKGSSVVMKERKLGNGRATQFFETEAALNRRLKVINEAVQVDISS